MSSPSEILSQFNLNNVATKISKPVAPVLETQSAIVKKSPVSIKQIGIIICIILFLGGGGYVLFKMFKKMRERHAQEIASLKASNDKFLKNVQDLTNKLNKTQVAAEKKITEEKPLKKEKSVETTNQPKPSADDKFTLLDQLV